MFVEPFFKSYTFSPCGTASSFNYARSVYETVHLYSFYTNEYKTRYPFQLNLNLLNFEAHHCKRDIVIKRILLDMVDIFKNLKLKKIILMKIFERWEKWKTQFNVNRQVMRQFLMLNVKSFTSDNTVCQNKKLMDFMWKMTIASVVLFVYIPIKAFYFKTISTTYNCIHLIIALWSATMKLVWTVKHTHTHTRMLWGKMHPGLTWA